MKADTLSVGAATSYNMDANETAISTPDTTAAAINTTNTDNTKQNANNTSSAVTPVTAVSNSDTTTTTPSSTTTTTTNTTPSTIINSSGTNTPATATAAATKNALNSNLAAGDLSSLSSAESRLKQLEQMFLNGPGLGQQCYSLETLLDVLLVLHDECINSSMRREKTVSDFIEYGEYCWYCLSLGT